MKTQIKKSLIFLTVAGGIFLQCLKIIVTSQIMKTTLLSLGLIVASTSVFAQNTEIKFPQASAKEVITQDFGFSKVSVDYSRPNTKGRKIFGGLVPYNEIWRTGANGATKITFGEEVLIDGKNIPAGEYALYSMPNEENWTLILSKNTKLWGSMGYQESEDVARFQVKAEKLAQSVETFTIGFSDVQAEKIHLNLMWETTKVSLAIAGIDFEGKMMKNIDLAMQSDKKPYWIAASYYLEHNKDLKQALVWASAELEQNPKAYWSAFLKGKIQAKLQNQDKKAIKATKETLQMALKLAEEAKNADYVKMIQETLQGL